MTPDHLSLSSHVTTSTCSLAFVDGSRSGSPPPLSPSHPSSSTAMVDWSRGEPLTHTKATRPSPLWVAWITKYKIRNCQHVPWGRRERLCEDENKAVAQGWDRGERETPDRLDSLTSWSWDAVVLPPISSVSEGKLNWVPATGHQQSQRNDPHTHYKWCSNWRQSSEDLLRTEVLSNRHGRELRVR